MDSGRILLIDDDPSFCALVERTLAGVGFQVRAVHTAASGVAEARRGGWDAVCLDLGLPDNEGLSVLRVPRAEDATRPIVILTAESAVDRVVAAMQEGAYDYLPKPLDRTKLRATVGNAVERHRLEAKIAALQAEQAQSFHGLIGSSSSLRAMVAQIERVACSDVTVSITGESGSGKELVARAIHLAGPRREGAFVAINCAAIPEALQESELFGHEKGAFTGALARRVGRLEQADGGTLFLDEVAELSPSLQAKLLRALQDRRITRVGGTQELETHFRVVTATHKDLHELVGAGQFREDLYYRLAVFELRVPPLRDRLDDLPLLANHVLMQMRGDGPPFRLAPETLDVFYAHPWRGNVRELQNTLQHAAVVSRDRVIRPSDLPARMCAETRTPAQGTPVWQSPPNTPALASVSAPVFDGALVNYADAKRQTVFAFEKQFVSERLRAARGNISEAARRSGMDRSNFKRLMREVGLLADGQDSGEGEPMAG